MSGNTLECDKLVSETARDLYYKWHEDSAAIYEKHLEDYWRFSVCDRGFHYFELSCLDDPERMVILNRDVELEPSLYDRWVGFLERLL